MKLLTRLIGWPLAIIVTLLWAFFCVLGGVAAVIDHIANYGMAKSSDGVYRSIGMISGVPYGEDE